jgi:curved DNA-binding protein CbpA
MPSTQAGQNAEKRRSTRIATGVFVRVRGVDASGKPFSEDRWTLNISFQGCKFLSRYSHPLDSWVTLEIFDDRKQAFSQPYRSRVTWRGRSQQLQGLFQVGVEMEGPGNLWGIANPPKDWRISNAPKTAKAAPKAAPKAGPKPASKPATKPAPTVVPQAATQSAPKATPKPTTIEMEIQGLLVLADAGNYYKLLRVTTDAPRPLIKKNYYELVRAFHPDRHMANPERTPSLNKLMEAVTTAYKTLTDETARQVYDEKLASGSVGVGRNSASQPPMTGEQCIEKAQACYKANNPGAAIVWMRRATELEPESPKFHRLLARALSPVAPLRKEAAAHYEKSLELDSWNLNARLELATLYEQMKLPWRARPHYEKVLELDAGNARATQRLRQISDAETGNKQSFVDRILHPTAK